jgi:hypothetical protein
MQHFAAGKIGPHVNLAGLAGKVNEDETCNANHSSADVSRTITTP